MLLALAKDELAGVGQAAWTWQHAPTVFAAYGGEILGFERNSDGHLTWLEPQSLLPVGRAILGVTLESMALDEANQTFYVTNNESRPGARPAGRRGPRRVARPSAGMGLDPANDRLYVNRPEGVVALDARTGQVLAQYPQAGVPAADPGRDYVYIAGTASATTTAPVRRWTAWTALSPGKTGSILTPTLSTCG